MKDFKDYKFSNKSDFLVVDEFALKFLWIREFNKCGFENYFDGTQSADVHLIFITKSRVSGEWWSN